MIFSVLLLACTGAPDTLETTALAGADRVIEVGKELSFDGTQSQGESAIWDLGDGTLLEGFEIQHVYSEPGRYTAVLQVTGSDGLKKTDSIKVVAHLPLSDHPPVWSSTVAVDSSGEVWVVNPEDDSIAWVVPETGAREVLESCESPRTLALDGDYLLVACDTSDEVVVYDRRTRSRLGGVVFEAGSRPFGVLGRSGEWWVGLQGSNALARFELSGETERVGNIDDPRALALDSMGELFATRWRSVDERGWIHRAGGGGIPLALDTEPDSDTTSGGVPTQLDGLSVSPDGSSLYVPGHQANVRRGEFLNGMPLTFETSVRAVLRVVSDGVEDPALTKLFDERGHANVAVPSPLGDLLYVLHPGTQSVSILNAYSGVHAGSILNVGHTPTGLAVSADGHTLYVNAWLDRQVCAYDVRDLSATSSRLGCVSTVESEPLAESVLSGKRLFYSSADTRMAKSGYFACAHCHADGRDDGAVWDFTDRGEGLRNTTSLEGLGAMPDGLLHWTGNFDEIQDFEADIRLFFGGSGFLSEKDWGDTEDALGVPKVGLSEELDDLAAYVASLKDTPVSPFVAPEGGEEAFLSAGCADCHSAPLYTDSDVFNPIRHDIGTLTEGSGMRRGAPLDGLDTPTLLGVHATPPYLHDGSATTLVEAIEAHESASSLPSSTLELIAGFVQSL